MSARHRKPLGARAAERVSRIVGSWAFLIAQTVVLAGWIVANALAWAYRWDPYPFVFLNLALSFQAAYTAPVLLMAAEYQEKRDRQLAVTDHEALIKLHAHLCEIDDGIEMILVELEKKDHA